MPRMYRACRLADIFFVSAGLMFLLALLGLELSRQGESVATVWLANAALIACLLRRSRADWPAMLAGILAGNVGAGLAEGSPAGLATALTLANLVEIAAVAWLFSRRFAPGDVFHSVEQLGTLGLLALIGPLLSTPLAGLSLALLGPGANVEPLLHWFVADTLGIIILTPLLLTFSANRAAEGGGSGVEFGLLLALAATAAFYVFTRDTSSLFLLTPLLVFAGLRLRVDRSALLVTLVCAVSLLATTAGLGPLNADHVDHSTRTFLLQAFMATVVMLVLPISALSQEKARTVAALGRREEQYRMLADHGSDLVLRLDPDGQARFVSSAVRRLLGLPEAALQGTGLIARIHAEDRSRFLSSIDRALRNGEAVACFRMRNARGRYRWIEAHSRRVGADGSSRRVGSGDHHSCGAVIEGRCVPGTAAPCGGSSLEPESAPGSALEDAAIVAGFRDIHERRSAELLAGENAARLRETNRLLLMAEGLASLGHWTFDPQRREVTLSNEAALLLELPQLTACPAELVALVRAEDRQDLLRALALARRYDAPAECVVRIDRSGAERTFQLRVQQRDLADRDVALFGVVSDITDKLSAEQRLVAALQEARSAAEFRSQFLATMSHEIRTPMTGVLGMIELLAEDPSAADRRLYLDTLRRSADLLMTVLNDVLDFSKVDSGQLRFADEPFDLGQLLRTTLHLFGRSAAARNLKLVLDAPEPDALWVRGDPLRLQQVLSNLLSNAIKFSDRGAVTLRCSARGRRGGRQSLRLSVEDRGIGIPPSIQQQLFEPFVQADLPEKRGGTGLGLAISRRLVAGMGGTISLRSAEGRGTTFQVDLSLTEARSSARSGPAEPKGAKVRPLDILLAEDNPINQLLVTALLGRMGHRVTCAADGEIAVRTAGERRFDLILMDMQMPRLDGLSAAAAIRSGQGPCSAIPILALTADAAERRPLYQDGPIDAVLTKPIDSKALAQALASWSGSAPPGTTSVAATDPDGAPLDRAALGDVRAVLGQARLDELLDLLADELEARPRMIRDALADRAFDRASAEAHSLKGAAANLGAVQVAAASATLEQAIAAAAGGNTASLAPALRALAGAVSDAQHALAGLPRAAMKEALRA